MVVGGTGGTGRIGRHWEELGGAGGNRRNWRALGGVPCAMRTTVTLCLALALAGVAAVAALRCPDGTSECPRNATCCVTPGGAWGCCPMPQASCCEDKVHCCPHATTCDLAHGRCLSPHGDTPLSTKFPAWKSQRRAPAATLHQVMCPDGRSVCPDGATCCRLPSAQYGCCPLQNAVCCSDGQHCCPQGTTCDLERSMCTSVQDLAQPPARVGDVKCDDEMSCPDGNTCCRLSSGAWGCCPLEQAVCCPDHEHCCPQGYTCDPQGGTCLQGGVRLPWLSKTPARGRGGDVKCDDETSCPDGSTCCRLSSGAWGCCPLEQAVCCPDHEHCCPQGYTCDPEGGTCLQGGVRLPWLSKTPARGRGGDVKCDDETSCPDGSTCCQLTLGTWACCPLEQAVCCKDHQHCCPRGYTCNVATQSCEKLLAATPLRSPAPAGPPLSPLRPVATIPGDTARACLPGQRCCRSTDGSWARCPFAQGSCCEDGRRCCPAGYRCTRGGRECWPQRWDVGGGISSRTLL
ncbi:progranulin isoform X3 [Cygnus olor]|uniref:progranulin isoform X3 n=1 Tax=Cygnus olor TaxID=8869 RepID=UPI001ADE1526|nr:progranulin isoform X3 [Cygnus olor]